ncbi:MAG TPA: hypothetical protein VLA64_11225 [Azonexus sp.]|nr:hypothetical protein [Azonexus sp.]
MRKQLIALGLLLHFAGPVPAQVGFSFGLQTDNVSISLSNYPNLVRVPGYPVYYASGLNSNYFFYDGMYWIFESDRWYSSTWYNGPWMMVDPEYVPVYVLRVPVRYYRRPPSFFVGWQSNSPPRWGDYWGNEWAHRRSGWDRWNRHSMPPPAPLPTYQRKYSGERYPSPDRQPVLKSQNYRYQARDPLVRQHSEASSPTRSQHEPAQRGRAEAPQRRNAEPAQPGSAPSFRHNAPASPYEQPQREREYPTHSRQPQAAPRMEERQAPRTEERPAPRNNPQPQRESNMRPQAEPNQPHTQPPNEGRRGGGPAESGQQPGQQREKNNSDEHGQGRGR